MGKRRNGHWKKAKRERHRLNRKRSSAEAAAYTAQLNAPLMTFEEALGILGFSLPPVLDDPNEPA